MAKLHANTGCWVRPRPGPEPGAWPEVVVSQRSSWLGPARHQDIRSPDTMTLEHGDLSPGSRITTELKARG